MRGKKCEVEQQIKKKNVDMVVIRTTTNAREKL